MAISPGLGQIVPALSIGSVSTGAPGASITGDASAPHLNLSFPAGIPSTTGEHISLATTKTLGSAASGCSLITQSGRSVGFTIPAGVSGAACFVQQKMALSAKDLAALVGATIRITLVASVTANFLTKNPAVAEGIVVIGQDGTTATNQGALVSTAQAGTVLTRQWTYVVTGNEAYVGAIYTVGSGVTIDTVTHSLQCVSVTYGVDATAGPSALSGSDIAVGRSLDAVNDNITTAATPLRLTAGELLSTTSSLGQALNGATLISVGGRPVGFTIPAGSLGTGSYVEPRMRISNADAIRLAGYVIRIRSVLTCTANYQLKFPFGGGVVYVLNQDGTSTSSAGSLASSVQTGTTLIREWLYTLTGNEAMIAGVLQIGAGAGDTVTHSFQVTSTTWMIDSVPAGLASNPVDNMLVSRLAGRDIGIGRIYNYLTAAPQTFNGAAVLGAADGRSMGLQIPAGQTGQTSIAQWKLAVATADAAALAGRTVRFLLGFTTTAAFALPFTVNLQTYPSGGGTRSVTTSVVRNVQSASTRRLIEFTAALTGDELMLAPYIQLTNTTALAALASILLTDIDISVAQTPSDIVSAADETLNWALNQAITQATAAGIAGALNTGYAATRTIATDGSGTYTSIAAGIASGVGSTIATKTRLTIMPGVYAENNDTCIDYVDLLGTQRSQCIIDGSLPANTDPATITNNSVLNCATATVLRNLTIKGANVRYAIHNDTSNNPAYRNRTTVVDGCHVEHLGNAAAQAYQDSISSGVTVWQSTHAYGCGLSSGEKLTIRNSTIKGLRAAFQIHTSALFSDPSITDLQDTRFIAENQGPGTGFALLLQANGSFQDDVCRVRGCELEGDIYYWPNPWQPTDLAHQPANHAEIQVSGYGNSPAVFLNLDFGAALRIDSANTSSTSSVAVSGSAVATLFGEQVYSVPQGGGVAAYVYGWADISGVAVGIASNVLITSPEARLGDCSTTPQSLVITIDGGTPITVTFNANYTGASAGTILGLINAALGSTGVASAWNVGARYRPYFRDEERSLLNTDTITARMGMALAYTNDRSMRVMTSADPASIFAGIAWEDIYPGAYGRVKTSGWLPVSDLLRVGGASLAFGATFNVVAGQPGYVSSTSGGSQNILPVVRISSGNAPAVQVAPKFGWTS